MSAILSFAQAHPDGGPTAYALCSAPDFGAAHLTVYFPRHSRECFQLIGGFSGIAGSFAKLSYQTDNLLHLGETMSVSAEYGLRLRRAEFVFEKEGILGKPITARVTVYGERFEYSQARESSIFAFQRAIPAFGEVSPSNLQHYVSHSYGLTALTWYQLAPPMFVGVDYGYDVTDVTPLSASTRDYFGTVSFPGAFQAPRLKGIRTSRVAPRFVYRTIDKLVDPGRGTWVSVSTAIAGLGGDVNTIEPVVDARHYGPGFKPGHVFALHLHARMIASYDGAGVPPYERYFMGGEDEIRGFDSWSIGPVGYLPSEAYVPVYNSNGSQRVQRVVNSDGSVSLVPVTQAIPIYDTVSVGGDTKVVTNIEYRMPLGAGSRSWYSTTPAGTGSRSRMRSNPTTIGSSS